MGIRYRYANESIKSIPSATSHTFTTPDNYVSWKIGYKYYTGLIQPDGTKYQSKTLGSIPPLLDTGISPTVGFLIHTNPGYYDYYPGGPPRYRPPETWAYITISGQKHPSDLAYSYIAPDIPLYKLASSSNIEPDPPQFADIHIISKGPPVAPGVYYCPCVFDARDADGQLVYSETRLRCPSVSYYTPVNTCPPNTCRVDCGTRYCCYNSQGISVFNYTK